MHMVQRNVTKHKILKSGDGEMQLFYTGKKIRFFSGENVGGLKNLLLEHSYPSGKSWGVMK